MTTRQLTTATVTVQDLRQVVAVAVARHPDARGRIEKAATILLLRSIRPDATLVDCFDVESESEPGRFYSVDDGVGVCKCQDYQHRGLRCKHLWSIRLLVALARLHRGVVAAAA
jgi:SWIM zinc finger